MLTNILVYINTRHTFILVLHISSTRSNLLEALIKHKMQTSLLIGIQTAVHCIVGGYILQDPTLIDNTGLVAIFKYKEIVHSRIDILTSIEFFLAPKSLHRLEAFFYIHRKYCVE